MDNSAVFSAECTNEQIRDFSMYSELKDKARNAPKFIDLFAGLGGFHTGFANSGFECVFACEIEPHLRELYKKNYGIEPYGDITKVNEVEVPAHDVMCAGFPCQPFSLAGKKKGAECPESGKLIDHVVRIAKYHTPKFVVLENVPNILTIAAGSFWNYLIESFSDAGYTIHHKVISPIDVGIPQNRKRVFIVAIRNDLDKGAFKWPENQGEPVKLLFDILDSSFDHKKLETSKVRLLQHWQLLLDKLSLERLGASSIVAPEFGATYPLNFDSLNLEDMKRYKGAYGADLSKCNSWEDILALMPSYTKKNRAVSSWLLDSVVFSRKLYQDKKDICDVWAENIDKKNNSWQILEWRGIAKKLDIYEHIVQFRASGIRILKPQIAPSLISMTPTQIPIIPSQSRYMSIHEAARLQNLHELVNLPESIVGSFKALGNAVNAKIVEIIANNLKLWESW